MRRVYFFLLFFFLVEHLMLDRGKDLLKIREVQISKKKKIEVHFFTMIFKRDYSVITV